MNKYACQMRYSHIGEDGQKKLKKSCVAIIGLGALGTVSATYLSRAGVGRLILVDKDDIEEVNLHRQILYSHNDIKMKKVDVAKRELLKANPDVKIISVTEFLSDANANKILKGSDLILDCTDKMSSRRVINGYCRNSKKTWIHSAVSGAKCNVLVVSNPELFSKHFRYEESFDDCNEFAVIGPIAGVAACIQTTEAIKILVGKEPCRDIQRFDLWNNEYSRIRIN